MSLSKVIEIVSGINEFGNLFQLVKQAVSYMRSQWSGTQDQQIQEHEVLKLQNYLRDLSETLPAMYNLIDRAEWRSHVHCVAELLPKLKDAVYDAEDLLDEFKWYELKALVEGNATEVSPFIDFIQRVAQDNFNKVTDIQRRLSNVSSQLDKMGLHEATPRFDKSVRPVTTSFPTEPEIIGREKEMEELLRWLGVPKSSKRQRSCNESTPLSVLPIVGMGGIGKTTIVQEITTRARVKSHFEKIIWICVSDDFNEETLTKRLIKSLSGKEATTDNFDDLQKDLHAEVRKKSFLLILDDIWPDAVKEDGLYWRKFFAPLRTAHQRSRLLVTTRFTEVAKTVNSMDEPFALEGLKPEVFWNFFKLCVFGSKNYPINSQLKLIGENICKNLKGSPLAAKTIGRLLRQSNNNPDYWNDILNSELWQLKQKETDILPALRLSYMYLPFHLKRCFAFCAVYPKDFNFEKARLAEIWVAEGFVEPDGNIQLQHIGEQYFEELVSLSFFQKLRGKYVIHDLIHDMAQLVSKDECFIAKDGCDYENIPQNVRHLSILANSNRHYHSIFRGLGKHTKLRTVLCKKSLKGRNGDSVLDRWFSEFRCLRVISLDNIRKIPENISNLKHLRYLKIPKLFDQTLPSSFCHLYNLQIFYCQNLKLRSLPVGLGKLINLQKFQSPLLLDKMEVDFVEWGKNIGLISHIYGHSFVDNKTLILRNLGAINKDQAADMKLWKMNNFLNLALIWSSSRSQDDNESEVLQVLRPPTNLESIHFKGYPGEYLPSWYLPHYLPEQPQSEVARLVYDNNGCTHGVFQQLTDLSIEGCENLSSLEQFLKPVNVPSVEKIVIENCEKLQLHDQIFEGFRYLTDLKIGNCPRLKWRSGMVLPSSLQRLVLQRCGDLSACFPTCLENLTSLLSLELSSCESIVSVPGHLWSSVLAELQELRIWNCLDLESIGGSNAIANINRVHITGCDKLMEVEQPLRRGGL